MTKTAVITIADLHSNSSLALCPPNINLDDGGTHHHSRIQSWLWRSWLDFCFQIDRDTKGMRKILVLNGDLGELDTMKRSVQLISLNKSTILNIVTETLEPILNIVDSVLVIRGTAAHEGKSSWLEETIAKDIGAISQTESIFSWWHYRGTCEGVRLDIAHHASKSSNPFSKGYGAIRVASRMQRYYQRMKALPPHVAVRSHNHEYEDSGGNYETFVYFTPAWTIKTEYALRIGLENALSDIGGVVIYCENGQYQTKKYSYEPKETKIWKLTL
jgi:hypothetical protein